MLNDKLEVIFKTLPVLAKARNFIEKADVSTADGRYEIESGLIFALVSRYATKQQDNVLMESHKKYGEIHFLIKGCEYIGFTQGKSEVYSPYNPETDLAFYHMPEKFEKLYICGKTAAFFNAGQLHAPRIACRSGSEDVIKAVIKFDRTLFI